MRRAGLHRRRGAEGRWRLLRAQGLRGGGRLLFLCGAGHLGEGGLLEGGRQKGIGGAAYDGGTQERIQVGATA